MGIHAMSNVFFRSRESPVAFYESKKRKSPTKHLCQQKPMTRGDDPKPPQQKVTLIEEEKLAEGVVRKLLMI